jgi:hypothetical protein
MHEELDLFGQVAVTWPEVVDWVARVAGITPDSPRWLAYVQAWDVAGKVRAAKLAGDWPPGGANPAVRRPTGP